MNAKARTALRQLAGMVILVTLSLCGMTCGVVTVYMMVTR